MHAIGFLFKRKPGMSKEEFDTHYRDIHAPIAATLPGLLEYRHYPLREANEGDVHAHAGSGFDALSIYIFPDSAVAKTAWTSTENIEVQIDTGKFIDLDSMITLPMDLRQVLSAF